MDMTVDAYIAQFPEDVQARLRQMRALIVKTAPQATEKISWGMPTYVYHGNLVHFAAQKQHMGFYPGPSGVEAFAGALAAYKTSKGAIQFPYAKPLPVSLIEEIIRFRLKENDPTAQAQKEQG